MSGQAVFFIRPFFVTQAGQRVWIGERSSWEQWIGLKLNFPSWVQVEPTRMLVENEAAFISALKTDLNKPLQETIMAEIDFLRLFLSTQRRHFLSIYTYLMPLMPGMTLLVFYEKLTTGPKTREDPFSTFSYHSILFLPILKSPLDTFPSHHWHCWTLFSPTLNHMGWFSS